MGTKVPKDSNRVRKAVIFIRESNNRKEPELLRLTEGERSLGAKGCAVGYPVPTGCTELSYEVARCPSLVLASALHLPLPRLARS